MEGGGAVEEDGVAFGDFFEDVPDFLGLLLDEFFGAADGVGVSAVFEFADDEGFEEDEGHFFGEAALVELEFGADDDDGAAGVVYAFAEEVLAEASAFAFDGVGEGFEGGAGVGVGGG